MTTKEQRGYLPANVYGAYGKTGMCPSLGATADTLEDVRQVLQVSLYQLGQLLGLARADSIYRYISGSRTPASFIGIRLTRLLLP